MFFCDFFHTTSEAFGPEKRNRTAIFAKFLDDLVNLYTFGIANLVKMSLSRLKTVQCIVNLVKTDLNRLN